MSLFGDHPHHLAQKKKPESLFITRDVHVVCCHCRSCLADDNLPAVTLRDVFSGKVKCEGELEVLAWKSPILPYKSYIMRFRKAKHTGVLNNLALISYSYRHHLRKTCSREQFYWSTLLHSCFKSSIQINVLTYICVRLL